MGLSGFIPSNNPKIIEELNTKYLNSENIVGRSDEIQTEPFFKVFENSEQETLTYILEEDIILTQIVLSVHHGIGGGTEDGKAYINTDLIVATSAQSSATEPKDNVIVINIPNWNLSAGTILKSLSQEGGAGSGNVTTSFIGYYSWNPPLPP